MQLAAQFWREGLYAHSSRASRMAASRDVSPGSIRPPGPLIFPAPNPRFLRINNTSPSRTTKSSVARSLGCQDFQLNSTERKV